jgi:hypothetical protein
MSSEGVSRLIGEFHSHLAVLPPILADREGRKPEEWDENDLRRIRHAARNAETGIVDVDAHVRNLVQYTEIPYAVVRNISILSLGRIAQKLIVSEGTMAFRHGTFLRLELDRGRAAEVLGSNGLDDRVVINVWPPGADLSLPAARRVPAPVLA